MIIQDYETLLSNKKEIESKNISEMVIPSETLVNTSSEVHIMKEGKESHRESNSPR